MSESSADFLVELQQVGHSMGPAAVLNAVIAEVREQKKYHNLFDALLMKKKFELGLPLTKPTSFDDVPEGLRDEFEKTYIASAREVGELLLADKSISQAWMYLRTIREPGKVAAAIEALPKSQPVEEDVLNIAFYEGCCPVKGVELMLASHGTCSTITALDQQLPRLTPVQRKECTAVMVREMYNALRDNVQTEVQRRQPMTPPGQTLKELVLGRDWLFADGNYHVDVSHLNSVVRFARALEPNQPELKLALQLAYYGTQLDPQYQYGGNAPFEEYYPAHMQYFKALLDDERDEALTYFREKLGPDAQDQETQMAALAYVDLLQRVGQHEIALDIACQYLANAAGEELGVSIPELCSKAGRYDKLLEIAQANGDLLAYTAALIHTTAPAR